MNSDTTADLPNRLISVMLRPVMLVWYAWMVLGLHSKPRPVDAPQAHGSGINPQRVLLFGRGPVEGFGVVSHQIALPGYIAQELASATGRGIDIDLVIPRKRTIPSVSEAFEAAAAETYDAVIVTAGASVALTFKSERRWHREVESLLRRVTEASSGVKVIVIGIQPSAEISGALLGIVEARVTRLNRITRILCARFDGIDFVDLPKASLPHGRMTGADYLVWARLLSKELAPCLREMINRPPSSFDDKTRTQAADRVSDPIILDSATCERLDDIVDLARAYFGTRFASFTPIAGHGEIQPVVEIGQRRQTGMRRTGAAPTALETIVIVEDSLADAQPRQGIAAADGSDIRSYFSYPVKSPGGQCVGVLSVSDMEPRQFSKSDRVMLRDLAIMVQRAMFWHEAHWSRPTGAQRPRPPFTGVPWT